jgi:DNA helicase-2/ATP-dependent DNA helicase PcrA
MSMGFEPTNEQLAIIQHPDEPLRVAAGAGTGKTTTIVERIAHLVDRGLDPSRILGVTFTNKAADELNQRVLDSIGADLDGRVPEISTYHGFAASVLDEFGAHVGYNRSAMLLDDGHRSELASRVLANTDTPDLDLTSISSRRGEMLALSSSLTDNLIEADAVRNIAPRGVHSVDLDAADDATRTWRKRLALVDAAEAFEAEKRRLGLVEYGDLIRLAVQVVEDSPGVAQDIRSRYDAVVLDEYQDTDPAQRKLLTALFSCEVAVIAVGDTDQTIYEWRGASAENFSAFPLDFPGTGGFPAETLPLSENRRSDRIILDLANRIRDEIPHVEGAKPLSPVPDAQQGDLVTAWFNTEQSEAAWIAADIVDQHRPHARWGDVAVLVRNRSQFGPIVEALRTEGIPYSVGSMGELLNVPEVADLLAWLETLESPSDEAPLLRILLGGRFRLGMTAIAQLRAWCRRNDDTSLFDAVLNAESIDALDERSHSRIRTFLSLHQELVRTSQVVGVSAVADAVIDKLGYWDEIAALDPSLALTARLNVGRFTDLAQQWRPIEGAPTLGGFLRYLTALAESGRADELASEAPTHTDAVSILTVHAAKGLEWDHVYLPGVADRVFPGRAHSFDDPDRISKLLPYELRLNYEIHRDVQAAPPKERTEILKRRHREQEWRLAYVAVTRAGARLVVSGHGWDGDIKNPRQPSPLWIMAGEIHGSQIGVLEPVSASHPLNQPYSEPAPAPDPLFASGSAEALRRTIDDPAWIRREYPDLAGAVEERVAQLELAIGDLATPRLEDSPRRFVVSVTNLVTLASCPQRFEWIHHSRLPRRPRDSALRGTEFHRRIELHNLGVIAFDDPETAEYDSGSRVDPQLPHQGSSDPWSIFEESRFSGETPIHIESPFEIEIGEGSVRGKIDAIYDSGGGNWEIVDYKSGRYIQDPSRRVQLEAYAIAAADGALSSVPGNGIDVTFAYFGGDDLVEITEPVDEEWLSTARESIAALVDQGVNGPFNPSPSKGCRWCDFLHLCPAGQQEVKDSQTI